MSYTIDTPTSPESGDFLPQRPSAQPTEAFAEKIETLFTDYMPSTVQDLERSREYTVHDPQEFSPYSTKGRVIGKTAVYVVIAEQRLYTVHSTAVDLDITSDPSLLAPDDIQTHGWMTERREGDLYDKRAERLAKLGPRVISISHVQNPLSAETRFFDLANDVNGIVNAIAATEAQERPYTPGSTRPVTYSGYSQGGIKSVVAAAQASYHNLAVEGLVLNRPAMFDERSVRRAVGETIPFPFREIAPIVALAMEDPRNLLDGAKIFKTSLPELVNHALVIPKMLGGAACLMSMIDPNTRVHITEAAHDVFNQRWAYSNYAAARFTNATTRKVHGALGGHLGFGSKKDEAAELEWRKRLYSDYRARLRGDVDTVAG